MNEIKTSEIRYRYTRAGNPSGFEIEMQHFGLHEHKLLSAKEVDVLQNKIETQCRRWNEKWRTVLEKKRISESKEKNLQLAEDVTKDAIGAFAVIENLLNHTLDIDDTVDWDSLKDRTPYSGMPNEPLSYVTYRKDGKPQKADYERHPPGPSIDDEYIRAEYSFFDKMFKSRREKRRTEAEERLESAMAHWKSECQNVDARNQKRMIDFEKHLAAWNQARSTYALELEASNAWIDLLKTDYQNGDPDAIKEYCELVLNNSKYPESFPQTFDIEYVPSTKILVVEYDLPSCEAYPTLKEVKYIQSRKELKESHLNQAQINKMFDRACYEIVLRTLHELFEADAVDALDAVSLNGWVNSINRATGKRQNVCILSIQAKKSDFMEIDLQHVDPKACFKKLKGVGSAKLSGLAPIQPIMVIDRDDSRFIEQRPVVDGMDSSTNLASMDWEEFEHLVREVFEKEFAVNGGEVKVTRASRDGGVDAIAIDPDPIRGGKIVIQAKRYINTVDVAAVRDLYGTVVNEGATKGILVTTSDYGPDAYKFASDKPITLLNGSNLLHLLEKHGHSARIDIREARRDMGR